MHTVNSINKIFPPLPLENWKSTKETLHLYIQIIGKIRLKLTPKKNHWWNSTLYINSRGIGTSPITYGGIIFEINFDFIEHSLKIFTSEGDIKSFTLHDGLTVAQFHSDVFNLLSGLGISVNILEKPYGIKSKAPFSKDQRHSSYDKEYVNRFWKILLQVDSIFKAFSGKFTGKCSPVQLFWHSLDLAVTRFTGKAAPEMKSGTPVDREAYSHEVISAGFWAGDDNTKEPAFYSYTYPLPDEITSEPLKPEAAKWIEVRGSPMALLTYEDLRKDKDPGSVLLEFLESSYLAGAKRTGLDVESFKLI